MRGVVLLLFLFGLLPASSIAQTVETQGGNEKLRVFVDGCFGGCDFTYLRSEITAVDFYRDNQTADVFVMINSNQSGGGGREYQMIFYGQQGIHADKMDTLYARTNQTDTDFEVREKISRYMKAGLAPFVIKTGVGETMDISMNKNQSDEATRRPAAPPTDSWDYWVFNVGGNFNANMEELDRRVNFGGRFQANRITDRLKLTFNANYDRGFRKTIRYVQDEDVNGDPKLDEDGEPILYEEISKFPNSSFNFSNQLVNTISQHWSYGYDIYGAQNTRANYQFRVGFRPAIEYNFFPESEQNSKFFRINYGIEIRQNKYVEETIYNETNETVFLQSIRGSLGYNQRWGSLEIGYRYRTYLHKLNFYTTGLNINTNIRVTGNLSFNINVEGNIIKDQIYLASGDYSQEDILSGNVTLPSDFTINTRFGFNYRFGSNLNNFVNRRFFGRGNFFSDN